MICGAVLAWRSTKPRVMWRTAVAGQRICGSLKNIQDSRFGLSGIAIGISLQESALLEQCTSLDNLSQTSASFVLAP